MSEPTAARWRLGRHVDLHVYEDAGTGDHYDDRVVALFLRANDARAAVEARAELAELHATDDYQRWARAVVERDAARDELRAAGVRFEKALYEQDAQLQAALAGRREVVARVRALCDEAERLGGGSASDYDKGAQRLAQRIVAALDGGAAT